jgi:tryptophan synthase alpha chain
MNKIDSIFSLLRDSGEKALMPFLVAGNPSLDATEGAILAMDKAVDIIEIGIPFSDPIADGPVIAAAMHKALESGITPTDVLQMVKRIRPSVNSGLVAMVSHSIVRRSGGTDWLVQAKEAGFDGVIIPDIDEVEAKVLSDHCHGIDLSFTMLVAPTSSDERIKTLASLSSGFLYILARLGLTGEQSKIPVIATRIEKIRSITDLPLAVGFGISTKAHVQAVHEHADAAIVGSALVRRMAEESDPIVGAEKFVREIS